MVHRHNMYMIYYSKSSLKSSEYKNTVLFKKINKKRIQRHVIVHNTKCNNFNTIKNIQITQYMLPCGQSSSAYIGTDTIQLFGLLLYWLGSCYSALQSLRVLIATWTRFQFWNQNKIGYGMLWGGWKLVPWLELGVILIFKSNK